jgi:hypothetical protein
MERQINARQLDVLRWIVEGCPEGRWTVGDKYYKAAANALQNRRLVVVQKIPPPWRAEATDAGRFYAEHGSYPNGHTFSDIDLTPVERVDQVEPRKEPRPAPPEITIRPPAGAMPLRAKTVLPNAKADTPAVRALKMHPHWAAVPKEHFGRVVRIAQHITDEAGRLGWAIILPDHPDANWHGWRGHSSKKPEFIILNAGHKPVDIMAKTFVDRSGGKKRLRIEVGRDYGEIRRIDDGKATFVEDKLRGLFDHVARLSLREQRRQCLYELRAIEIAKEREVAMATAARARTYSEWHAAFSDLQAKWVEHKQRQEFLADFVSRVERAGDAEQEAIENYVRWARTFVEESDPFRNPPVPVGEVPDMSYREWVAARPRQYRDW